MKKIVNAFAVMLLISAPVHADEVVGTLPSLEDRVAALEKTMDNCKSAAQDHTRAYLAFLKLAEGPSDLASFKKASFQLKKTFSRFCGCLGTDMTDLEKHIAEQEKQVEGVQETTVATQTSLEEKAAATTQGTN